MRDGFLNRRLPVRVRSRRPEIGDAGSIPAHRHAEKSNSERLMVINVGRIWSVLAQVGRAPIFRWPLAQWESRPLITARRRIVTGRAN